jgi:uncharacterized protein
MKKIVATSLLAAFGILAATQVSAGQTSLKAGMNVVQFESNGTRMAGNLFLPSNYRAGQKLRAVVVTGTWTSVKEMMANTYARQLASQGIAALTFDFRGFGASGGTPRFVESATLKAQDINSAAQFLAKQDFVSSVGGLAVCASAGYLAKAIVDGAPINSYASVAGWFMTPETAEMVYGGKAGVAAKIAASQAAKAKFDSTGVVDYVPAYSETNPNAAMYGNPSPFDYYANSARGAIKQWDNQFAVKAWQEWLEFNPVVLASRITTPSLIVHSDNAALPIGARAFFEGLKGPKNMFWTQGGHFDFYDTTSEVNRAAKVAAAHFISTLK